MLDAAQTQDLLRDYLQQSAIELLSDSGAQFETNEAFEWTPEVVAILGFAGTDIAGSVALCTSHECLDELARLGHATLPEDWLGELSNQLAGRFKRRLAPHGASFGLSTPVILLGDRLRLAARTKSDGALSAHLDSSIGQVVVWLEIEFRNGFALAAQPKDDGTLIEGEALLF
jgi:CheY-specific phosphatase CheX